MERKKAAEASGMAEDTFDPVPEITAKHFQEAMKDARRTVSDESLRGYSKFATDMQQARSQLNTGTGVSLANFQMPTNPGAAGGAGGAPAAGAAVPAEEDLYA
jgi:transitional endoplasmic reticulum ATPase